MLARQALQGYAPNTPKAWQAELYSYEAYTIVWLAEIWCNGMPVSDVSIEGHVVPSRALHTEELFDRAVTLFDSALAVSSDSVMVSLARVGKARALLGLGKFTEAAAAAQPVSTQFVFSVQFGESDYYNMLSYATNTGSNLYRVADNEGGNGLVWSTDARTAVGKRPGVNPNFLYAFKYYTTPSRPTDSVTANPTAPIRLADGLEARLIEAEAALAVNNASWLTILNTLRSTCIQSAACAPVTGIDPGELPALTDPGTPAARLDLLMQERAMWLYLTAHRSGDLRRMSRLYQRDPLTLWPTGVISSPAFPGVYSFTPTENGQLYSNEFVFLPHSDEQFANPKYAGCYDLNP